MSYTLKGRLESRLAALLPVLAAACLLGVVLHRWWPIELAAVMAALGVALDLQLYHRLLAYQPGWAMLPLGLLELALLLAVVRIAGLDAPLVPALALYGAAWACAQMLGHAGFPLVRVSYAEDGGELGAAGALAVVVVAATLATAGAVGWLQRPPTVHLAAGVHQGPLVIGRRMILVGERGAVVRGGILVRADGVTIRDVTVVGGANGIDVDGVQGVRLERVTVSGARLDGIHVRRAAVTISDCSVNSIDNPYGQGIDISYAFDKKPSIVTGCTVVGGQEGIVTHFTNAMITQNHVSGTRLRAISMTEMSMGMIDSNEVTGALGVGILCNDHSMCMIERNVVTDTRPDSAAGDLWRAGFGVLASYGSEAELKDNSLGTNPRPSGAVLDSRLVPLH
jgi:Right handed beta helix region